MPANRGRRGKRRQPDRKPPPPAEVVTTRPTDEAMAEARRLAGGDARRLRPQRDGTVLVVNGDAARPSPWARG